VTKAGRDLLQHTVPGPSHLRTYPVTRKTGDYGVQGRVSSKRRIASSCFSK
jgi:hypothetical protein